MKYLILILLLPVICFAQTVPVAVLDSVVWTNEGLVNAGRAGDANCQHEWVYGDTCYSNDIYGFLGYETLNIIDPATGNTFLHCVDFDLMRKRICKVCKRWEWERQRYYYHWETVETPKTDYEELVGELE